MIVSRQCRNGGGAQFAGGLGVAERQRPIAGVRERPRAGSNKTARRASGGWGREAVDGSLESGGIKSLKRALRVDRGEGTAREMQTFAQSRSEPEHLKALQLGLRQKCNEFSYVIQPAGGSNHAR